MIYFHLGRVCVWLLMVPISYATGWLWSVAFVSILSIVALAEGAASAAEAAYDKRVMRELEALRSEVAELSAFLHSSHE